MTINFLLRFPAFPWVTALLNPSTRPLVSDPTYSNLFNVIDILWILVCSGLVFSMQAGFMCLESGLTRSKNSINVAVKNLADFGISAALFACFGYGLMFGVTQGGWVGGSDFFLPPSKIPLHGAFFLFQIMFCSTATTIVSGAVAERMHFAAYLIIAGLVSGILYPLFGHWAWNGIFEGEFLGWLGKLGFVDFAGSTVVHSMGAWVSLAALLVIGARVGRFSESGRSRPIQGSNLPLAVLGALILWLGWLGFNGGSTITFNAQVPQILLNTVLAGVAGMIVATTLTWHRHRVPSVEMVINGSIAGLVAITASCHAVSSPLALLIGGVGAAVMVLVSHQLERWKIDDAVDAVAVHGGAGIWGTLAVGFFGNLDLLGTGLGRWQQIGVQFLGCSVALVWGFGLTYLILASLNRGFPLRVSLEDEKMGLNVSEHKATTELYDLFRVMDQQATTQDLSLRVPVEPFTEVGQIATRYNQVMDALEEAMTRTEGIVKTATDAILTFTAPQWQIMSANPSAELVFGYSVRDLIGMSLEDLIYWEIPIPSILHSVRQEISGQRSNGEIFPLEATIQEASLPDHRSFFTGTFRDITERKAAETALQQANQAISQLNEQLQGENLRLGAELEVTRQLQQMLLPREKDLAAIADLDIAGFMEPASEIGGDYYDILNHEGRIRIGIGDVTGHGLESGVLMIMVQTAVRTLLATNEQDPKKFWDTLNRTIYDNVQRMQSDKNLTLSLLDYYEGKLRLSGQHEELILIRANGEIERIDTIDLGFPIGLDHDIRDFVGETHLELKSGDVAILYTDGITEAENLSGECYGLERLCQAAQKYRHLTASEIQKNMIEEVRTYIGTQQVYDDITLVVLKQK